MKHSGAESLIVAHADAHTRIHVHRRRIRVLLELHRRSGGGMGYAPGMK